MKKKPSAIKYRKRNQIGTRLAQKKLNKLLKLHNNRCHYCDLPVIRVRDASRLSEEIAIDAYTITGRIGDVVFTYPIATTEHLKRKANGGDHNIDNLVVACWFCNQLLSNLTFPIKLLPDKCSLMPIVHFLSKLEPTDTSHTQPASAAAP